MDFLNRVLLLIRVVVEKRVCTCEYKRTPYKVSNLRPYQLFLISLQRKSFSFTNVLSKS